MMEALFFLLIISCGFALIGDIEEAIVWLHWRYFGGPKP